MSASFSVAPQGGIMLLNVSPATSIGPVTPCSRMRTTFASSPVTHSLPASGGYTPGTPSPDAWWHAAQVVEKTCFPSDCAPATDGVYSTHADAARMRAVSYTHLRAHETPEHLVCR